jgi:hypothetical protein
MSKGPCEESFVNVVQLKGWNGAQTKTDTPQVPRPVLKVRFRREMESRLDHMPSIRPPFFSMSSPQGTELIIPLDCHWLLIFSLVLDLAETPASSYKVHQNHPRKFVAHLERNGKLSLSRNDQSQKYKIAWCSEPLGAWWCDIREAFQDMCEKQPQDVHVVQRSLLEVLLGASTHLQATLKNQVRRYCYSTNAWWSLGREDGMERVKVTTTHFRKLHVFSDDVQAFAYKSPPCSDQVPSTPHSEAETDDTQSGGDARALWEERTDPVLSDSGFSTNCSCSDPDEISSSASSDEAKPIRSASPSATPGIQTAALPVGLEWDNRKVLNTFVHFRDPPTRRSKSYPPDDRP